MRIREIKFYSIVYYIGIILISYPLCAYLFNTFSETNLPELNALFIPCIFFLILLGFVSFYLKKKNIGRLTTILVIIYIWTIIYDLMITYP